MTYVENYNIEEIFFEVESTASTSDSNTFLDWLNLSKKENFNKQYKIKHQQELISSFIQTAPRVQPVKAALNAMDTNSSANVQNEVKTGMPKANELIVSETLAKIYYEQKKYNLAIETYKKLRLVYPEKSSYFAALIKEVEKDITEGKG